MPHLISSLLAQKSHYCLQDWLIGLSCPAEIEVKTGAGLIVLVSLKLALLTVNVGISKKLIEKLVPTAQ